MSCTVLAVPYAMAWIVGALAISVSNAIADSQAVEAESQVINDDLVNICEDVHVVTESTFLEKSLETPFMDKTILLKTLEEHGVKNINEDLGKIKGVVDTYQLSFEKMEDDKPYFLTISYLEQNNPEEKLNDLNSEYALNVQEDAYLNIIEKLKNNNMQIEEEEVLEDNTIVLTVNLEG